MAADLSLAVNTLSAPVVDTAVPEVTGLGVLGFNISTFVAPSIDTGSGGGGSVRPTSGFIYPRGDS
jgi:hypothetical protein